MRGAVKFHHPQHRLKYPHIPLCSIGASGTFAGAINDTGGSLILTPGAQTLSGVNGHTGATTINGGTLALNSSSRRPDLPRQIRRRVRTRLADLRRLGHAALYVVTEGDRTRVGSAMPLNGP